jgi:hypothetical protein
MQIIDLVQGSVMPTAIILHSDAITCTSLPVSLKRVSENTRQAIASRFANLNIRFDLSDRLKQPRFWIEKGNVNALNDIWAEVYPIWRRIVEDDEIFGQELVELSLADREASYTLYRILFPSLIIYFLLAFASNTTFNINYITGRALARTSSGKLALVHTSA